jgi:putative hemolysin
MVTGFLIVCACIALNAVLAALEVAFLSASRAALRAEAAPGDPRVQRFLDLRDTPERTLSAIQVGVTLVGIVSGAVGGASAQEFVTPRFEEWLGLNRWAAQTLAIAAVSIPLMLGTVIVGELVPKVIALRNPERLALAGARGLHLLEHALLPVVWLLAWATRVLAGRLPALRLAPRGPASERAQTARHYALDLHALAQRSVRDAMVPWVRTTSADESLSPHALSDLALSSGHTRLPVVRNGTVVGLLHTKELLRFLAAGQRDWRPLVRPITTVTPEQSLLGVLRLLQHRRTHLAVVTDGGGAPAGVVTLEDILEEVLGDLYDEDDDGSVEQLLAARGKLRQAAARRPTT